jgi:hypothetical protein
LLFGFDRALSEDLRDDHPKDKKEDENDSNDQASETT